jgi:endonuclease-3
MLKKMKTAYGEEKTALRQISNLESSDPFVVLISTILSARTRDERTEVASNNLFAKYKDCSELAKASPGDIAKLIREVNFYKTKAKRIIEVARILMEKYDGNVPKTVDELDALPGVGRKTANCVLVYGFSKPAIPVDVHVHRISNRLGFFKTDSPEETEKALQSIIPKRYWLEINETFVKFGQTVCRPMNPRCRVCPLTEICDYFNCPPA